MKYQFEVDEEITRCEECPCSGEDSYLDYDEEIDQEFTVYDSICSIARKILVGNKRPDWCPLVKVADHTPILEKLKAELATLEQLQNNETDQERYETRRDAINYIKGKISTYEYVVWVSNVG